MSKDRLAFLDNVLGSRKRLYRQSKWLASDFEDDVWIFKMTANNVASFQIDFNKILLNGTILTDEKNRRLLNTFKYWINASIHHDNTKGRGGSWADATARGVLRKVFYLIDYFLLNDHYLKTTNCGLQAISADNLRLLADSIASNKLSEEHIYGWTERLSKYLIDKTEAEHEALEVCTSDGQQIDLKIITDDQLTQNTLKIPLDRIPQVRSWVWRNGYYNKDRKGEYQFSINTKPIVEFIYGPFTLVGASSTKSIHPILSLGGVGRHVREFPMVPVRTHSESGISYATVKQYKSAMKALLLLKDEAFADEGLLLPNTEAIDAFINYWPDNVYSNRFATLPSKVVFTAIKDAIEFHHQYADSLINSLRKLLPALVEKRASIDGNKQASFTHVISTEEFLGLLDPAIRKLGIKGWTSNKEDERFEALRSNKGLGELIRVYHGGVQIVVAVLMARRQTELASLKVEECLDETRRWLVFGLAKSTRNLEGRRVRIARPIDGLAVEMIEKLIEIQRVYLDAGLINKFGLLYDTVSLLDPAEFVSSTRYKQVLTQSVDMFCDYFETPVRYDGMRYYIRTHQLRRFFAISFFWGSGFGGMDTLRWFMGHTDPEHLYRYITENTPGEVLRHAKAQFLSETIEEHGELKDLISHKYGTGDFTLLNTEELEEYIDDLISEGKVEVEPEFIDDGRGNSYRLMVIIRDVSND